MGVNMLLKPEDYYTQINNKHVPSVACMNTSRVMFYLAAKIPYTHKAGTADDDYFYELLDTDNAKDFAKAKYPWLKGLPPNELHGMYGSYLDKLVTGKRRTDFYTDLTWDGFITQIAIGNPVMTSGRFPRIPGHAFVFIGYDHNTKELIAADPYGDPHTGYKSDKGYGIRYTKDYFEEHVKPGALKWGHIRIDNVS